MPQDSREPIVSSHHLAEGGMADVSEYEFGLMIAYNSFARWVSRCMAASGLPELGVLESLVLHHVNHRARDKRLTDICFLLNIEDPHLVNYALKKLLKQGLLTSEKRGKEVFYAISETGRAICQRYSAIRRQCLLDSLPEGDRERAAFSDAASFLRRVSGHYDQASRAAASL